MAPQPGKPCEDGPPGAMARGTNSQGHCKSGWEGPRTQKSLSEESGERIFQSPAYFFLPAFVLYCASGEKGITASKPGVIREARAAVEGRDRLKKPTLKAHTETGSHLGSPEKAELSPTCASELKASETVMRCATVASHLAFLGHF